MKDKLFKNICLASMAVFVLTFVLVIGVLYNTFSAQHREELEAEGEYLASLYGEEGEALLQSASRFSQARITLIDSDGRVLFDSVSPEVVGENHSDRQEFADAVKNGRGSSSRYSETLAEKTVNYAVRLENGRVLRVSSSRLSLFTVFGKTVYPFLLVFAFAMIISVVLASSLSKSITKPILEINPDSPDDRFIYEELRPFVGKIHEQNRQIRSQMEEMKKSHESQEAMRREFTANVSHELKTPLTSISGTAEIIKNDLVRPEDIPHFAENIYNEASRLITLVEDIIRLSQLDEDQIPASREAVDLLSVAEDVKERLRGAADKAGVTISVEGERAVVCGVPPIIDEMVYNLCDNAVKYNRENGSVTVRTERRGEKVILSVSDSGIGIPKEELGRIFERFYRVDKSHSKQIGGTGLGLSIVKHGAAFHGAAVEVDSTPGVGTTVRIIFNSESDDEVPLSVSD